MAKRRLEIIITGDEKGGKDALDRLGSGAGSAEARLAKLSSGFDAFGAKASAAGRKLTLGVTVPLATAGFLAVKAASDLEQAGGATESVFGRAIGTIEQYAARSVEAVGLSERAYRELAAVAGAQLQNLGLSQEKSARQANKLITIGADLAATFGGTTKEAVEALTAAYRGEADPAEKFGLRLNINTVNAKAVEMQLAKSTSKVDDHARAQALMALIVEQSGGALGQFARESDTLAVKQQKAAAELENAAASIGAVLLPIAADAVGVFADLATAAGSLPGPVKEGAVALGALLAALGPVTWTVGKLAQGTAALIRGYSAVSSALETLALRGMYALESLRALAMNPQVLALATVTAAIIGIGLALRDTNNEWAEAEKRGQKAGQAMVDAARASGHEITFLRHEIDLLTTSIRERAAADDLSMAKLIELKAQHGELVEALRSAKREEKEAQIAEQARRVALNELAAGTTDLTTATDAAIAALRSLQSQVLAMSGGEIGYQQALISREKAQAALNEAIAEHGPTSREAQAATLDLEQAELAAASAAWSQTDSVEALKREIRDDSAFRALIAKLEEEKRLHPEVAAATQAQIDKVVRLKSEQSGIPASILTRIDVDTSAADWKLAAYRERLRSAYQAQAAAGIMLGYQHGGPVPGSPSTAVPAMLHGGEYVLSADVVDRIRRGAPSRGAMLDSGPRGGDVRGGNSYTIQVVVPPGVFDLAEVGRHLANAIKAYEERGG